MIRFDEIAEGGNYWISELKDFSFFLTNSLNSTVSVSINGDVVFSDNILHDSYGYLYFYDLDKIVLPYFQFFGNQLMCSSSCKVTLTLKSLVSGSSSFVTNTRSFNLYYIDRNINKSFSDFSPSHFFAAYPIVMTSINSFDFVSVFIAKGENINIRAKLFYTDINGNVGFNDIFVTNLSGSEYYNFQTYLISWKGFNYMLPAGAHLVTATVYSDKGHKIDFRFYNDVIGETFYFINAFGLPEILHLPSVHSDKVEYEQLYVNVERQLNLYLQKNIQKKEVTTGILPFSELPRIRHFFSSQHIYLTSSGNSDEKIVLSDIEDSVSTDFSAVATFKFSYQYADISNNNSIIIADETTVFDETFDNSFE